MQPVFLVGFMASGKSTVGTALAAELDAPFVDLDRVIETRAGSSIADIFAKEGEAGFRQREAAALADVIAGEPAVVATGGGAPCFGDNLERMRQAGWVVHLSVPLEDALARAGAAEARPLLAQSPEAVRTLYRDRLPIYRRAHATVATEGRRASEVAGAVAQMLRAIDRLPRELLGQPSLLALGDRSHPVVVRRGALDALGELVCAAAPRARRVGLVTDANVGPLYAERAAASLRAIDGVDVAQVTVPAGETAKSLGEYGRVAGELIAAGLDRSSVIVALGGGVVGDLAGFVAASLYRGVPVVQVPTTLVAMTDSAIGGKTGINTEHGKNLVGAFWQPLAVVADPDVLATLPVRERRAACGELVKYGLLDGPELFAEVERLAPAIAAEPFAATDEIAELVSRCAAVKAGIVGADERESGLRASLNLGHTVGHAIEAAAGYGQVLHGEAVALGLVAACRVSARLGLADAALEGRVAGVLAAAGLDVALDPWLRPEVLERAGVDKKRTGSRIRFITVAAPGDCRFNDIGVDDLGALLGP